MKKIRQKTILELVRNQQIASQEELMESLQARNIEVSQSTLSRDIQELRLAKTGGVYAVMGQDASPSSEDSVRRILREFVTDVAVAQNLVVLKTGPGNASAVTQAIDRQAWPEIVGSIAGDDTIFIAAATGKQSRELADRVLHLLK
jgi:transcriptional regulator of arginine metabolism